MPLKARGDVQDLLKASVEIGTSFKRLPNLLINLTNMKPNMA